MKISAAQCRICPKLCSAAEGQPGRCGVRLVRDGRFQSAAYGRLAARSQGVIEHASLYHVFPGASAALVGLAGCSLDCMFCSNWELAHRARQQRMVAGDACTSAELVAWMRAKRARLLVFTYTEATVNWEYLCETADLARADGLVPALVSSGYLTEPSALALAPRLAAVRVDLKAADELTYQRLTGGQLQAALDCLSVFRAQGCWVEVSTVMVPGINDQPEAVERLATQILERLGPEAPWHLMRFFPSYRASQWPVGDLPRLSAVREQALALGLRHVYISNVPGLAATTYCAECGQAVIERPGGGAAQLRLINGACPRCQRPLAGIGLEEAYLGPIA